MKIKKSMLRTMANSSGVTEEGPIITRLKA
jgi:hypothetical protein